jgi:Protein of unknown function (DUF4239)
MPLWIYNMPDWLIGVLVVGGCMGAGVGGHVLLPTAWRHGLVREDPTLLVGLVILVSGITLGLLSLCAASSWEAATRSAQTVEREAGVIGALGRSLGVMSQGESSYAKEQLRAYTRSVILKEWPAMQEGRSSLATWDAFDSLFRSLAAIQPSSAGDRALMPELWRRVHELLTLRQSRLSTSPASIPGVLWAVTATSSGLALGLLTLLPATRMHRVSAILLSLLIGLGLTLALSMERPFCLGACLKPEPFETALQRMDRWDQKSNPVWTQ